MGLLSQSAGLLSLQYATNAEASAEQQRFKQGLDPQESAIYQRPVRERERALCQQRRNLSLEQQKAEKWEEEALEAKLKAEEKVIAHVLRAGSTRPGGGCAGNDSSISVAPRFGM